MDKVIMCGTDLHDRTMTSQIGVNTDKPRLAEFPNTKRGREKLFRLLKAMAKQYEATGIFLAYEASCLGFGLYDECVEAGIQCFVLAPTGIKKNKKERKRKDDKRDAKMILEALRGHIMAGNELPSVWVPDPQTRDDREIVRGRLNAADAAAEAKTKIRMLMKRSGVVKPKEVRSAWSEKHRAWLRTVPLPSGARFRLDMLLEELQFAEGQLPKWDEELERLAGTERYARAAAALITNLKGVGLLTAMVFLTEMGDLTRFQNRKEIGSYIGLTPCSNETGEDDDKKGHITRDGSDRLRKVLCQASWVRVRLDKKEGKAFERIKRGTDRRKKVAIVAAMRRLAIVMWHIALEAQLQTDNYQRAA
jgi:transposase